ncbi:MAG: SMI1/KNR4 family protein [Deltaproteobacteria bacterium]|nr:SMI1/KNR4 family protein [Deltaproteobacteria bacterium]
MGSAAAGGIRATWDRIEGWLRANAPELLTSLRLGASKQDIAAFERQVDHSLPLELRNSVTIHDGEKTGDIGLLGPLLLPLAKIERLWSTARHHEGWRAGWLPITDDGAGNHLFVDLTPPSGGTVGQVILYFHETKQWKLRAPNFGALLHSYADALESGKLVATERNAKFFALLRPDELTGALADVTIRRGFPADGAGLEMTRRQAHAQQAMAVLQLLKSKGCLDSAAGPALILLGSRLREFLARPFATNVERSQALCAWLLEQPELRAQVLPVHEIGFLLERV